MQETKLLDHGYLKLIERWGSDEMVIESARMSTGGKFVSWEPYEGHPDGDFGLLKYLYKNGHLTPFEMSGMTVEVKCPIFVARQWMRHGTQRFNEESARYTILTDDDYVPTVERCMMNVGTKNRQAAGVEGKVLTAAQALEWIEGLCDLYERCQAHYMKGLDFGIPKELARLALTVSRYTSFRATCNLRNWLHFVELRDDDHAQWETRQYGRSTAELVDWKFPRTYMVFKRGRTA